jgi:hypothetical protein
MKQDCDEVQRTWKEDAGTPVGMCIAGVESYAGEKERIERTKCPGPEGAEFIEEYCEGERRKALGS